MHIKITKNDSGKEIIGSLLNDLQGRYNAVCKKYFYVSSFATKVAVATRLLEVG